MRRVTKDFDKSPEKRYCRKCKGEHGVGYVTWTNGEVQLMMYCDVKRETEGTKFELGLDVPSVLSVPARKHNRKIDEIRSSLFYKYQIGRQKRSDTMEKIKPY